VGSRATLGEGRRERGREGKKEREGGGGDIEQVLRQSKEVHFWKYDQHRIAELEELLEKAH
jgi:hypothetical protein